jgi:hypothetical protein
VTNQIWYDTLVGRDEGPGFWQRFTRKRRGMQSGPGMANHARTMCGACQACKATVPPVRPDGAQRDLLESSVEVVAVDFVRQNAATLTRLFRHFSVRGAVVHAAASDKREEVCSPSVQHPYYTAAHPLSVILTRLTSASSQVSEPIFQQNMRGTEWIGVHLQNRAQRSIANKKVLGWRRSNATTVDELMERHGLVTVRGRRIEDAFSPAESSDPICSV